MIDSRRLTQSSILATFWTVAETVEGDDLLRSNPASTLSPRRRGPSNGRNPVDWSRKSGLVLLKKRCNIFNINPAKPVSSQVSRIQRRISAKGPGWAFTPHDLADFGDSRSIGMALTRLVRDGQIRRIGRGLYDKPHPHPILGQTGAGTQAVVDAVARKKNLRILPSSAVAANQLGLSSQVPAKLVYHTDGAPADLHLGKLHLVFRRNGGRLLALSGRASGLVAQAMRALGQSGVQPSHIQHLRARLDAGQKKQLLQDIYEVPAWMRPHFQAIADPTDT